MTDRLIHDPGPRRAAVAELRLPDMDRDAVATRVIVGPVHQISTDGRMLRAACYRKLTHDNAAALLGLGCSLGTPVRNFSRPILP